MRAPSILLFLCQCGTPEKEDDPRSSRIQKKREGGPPIAAILAYMAEAALDRHAIVQRGKRLEYFTIAWNTLEGIVALMAGAFAGSIALAGFGLDSFVEVASGMALLWRMAVDADESRREQNERLSLRIVGVCFLALATYIALESARDLIAKKAPEHSVAGIIIAVVSLIVMPVLSQVKRRVGRQLGSAAMQADATQTQFCTYLSAILLGGLLLNMALGWWWADPVAALVMVPIIAKEGIDGVRGEHCC